MNLSRFTNRKGKFSYSYNANTPTYEGTRNFLLRTQQRIPLRSSLYGADIWMTRHISHPLRTDSTGRETHATCDKPEIGKGGF